MASSTRTSAISVEEATSSGNFEGKPDNPFISICRHLSEGRLGKTLDRMKLARIEIQLCDEVEGNRLRLILGQEKASVRHRDRSNPSQDRFGCGSVNGVRMNPESAGAW